MEKVLNVASYVFNRYNEEYGQQIDEMKLHKLLYFTQRESYIQNNAPLFNAVFYGWKYGPVLKEVRDAYKKNAFFKQIPEATVLKAKPLVDRVFEDYASKDSWALSRHTHAEQSWKNSRIGISDGENGDVPMKDSDIILDARRMAEHRNMLKTLGR